MAEIFFANTNGKPHERSMAKSCIPATVKKETKKKKKKTKGDACKVCVFAVRIVSSRRD